MSLVAKQMIFQVNLVVILMRFQMSLLVIEISF